MDIWLRTVPSAGFSSYSVPPVSLYWVTQTAPPPTTGDPPAPDGPRHSTWICLCCAFTRMAARPLWHGSYTVSPETAAAPYAGQMDRDASSCPIPPRLAVFSRYPTPRLPMTNVVFPAASTGWVD